MLYKPKDKPRSPPVRLDLTDLHVIAGIVGPDSTWKIETEHLIFDGPDDVEENGRRTMTIKEFEIDFGKCEGKWTSSRDTLKLRHSADWVASGPRAEAALPAAQDVLERRRRNPRLFFLVVALVIVLVLAVPTIVAAVGGADVASAMRTLAPALFWLGLGLSVMIVVPWPLFDNRLVPRRRPASWRKHLFSGVGVAVSSAIAAAAAAIVTALVTAA